MASFHEYLQKAVDDGVIIGAVLAAKDASGNVDYFQALGNSSLKPDKKPMQHDTVFSMASLTKLMTTIAVLQLVERKLVQLDDDVTPLLPDLAKQEVLVGFDRATNNNNDGAGKPILRKRSKPITLRQLLTHSFGGAYDFMHPGVMAYKRHHGYPPESRAETLYDLFGTPLVFEPGEGWVYSGGLDWAGRLVEVLTGLDLDAYMRRHIWAPLGLRSFTFWPDAEEHREIGARLAAMTIRDGKSGRAVQSRRPIRIAPRMREACGGQGAFGTAPEYLEILRSLLVEGDERLLGREAKRAMFTPQLEGRAKEALVGAFRDDGWAIGDFPRAEECDWGLGGLLVDGESHPYRKRGTLIWSGAPNLFWWIDRTSGVCGVFACQLFPSADAQIGKLIHAFEEEVYRLHKQPAERL